MIFADTNILVYAVDPREPVKRAIARRLLREAAAGKSLVLSTQVLQEFYVTVLRQRLLSAQEAAEALRLWMVGEVVGATPALVLQAVELHQQHGFAFWDALVVRAAIEAGCTTLYSEDMQHGRSIGGLAIVNPFLHEVHEDPPDYLEASTAVSVDGVLRLAIAARRLIAFTYEGRSKQGEPHDYGLIGGQPRLNFFQTRGRSRNGVEEAGRWKTLDPAKMTRVRVLPQGFAGTRTTTRGAHKRWDEIFASVTPRLKA